MGRSSWTVTTQSADETRALGTTIGIALRGGEVLLLVGPLGAGKTTLTQGIATGLGVEAYTKSPSFVLVNEYQGRLPLYHMDLYRIDDPDEAWDLGLDDNLRASGVLVVEWGDRAPTAFPSDRLRVEITPISENQRTLSFIAEGPAASDILAQIVSRWSRQGVA